MRQGQQHRRSRNRNGQGNTHNANNNPNRKGQNPISRSYQSNGPDGKVSGTAAGIAEKYLSLARDAHSSGDPVLAENYLQHAEHYNRIILAYRETLNQGGSEDGGNRQRNGQPSVAGDAIDESTDDEVENYGRDMQPLPPMEPQNRLNDPQPRTFDAQRADSQPRENPQRDPSHNGQRGDGPRDGNRFDDRQPRMNDQQRRPQRDRFEPRERYGNDRSDRNDRDRGDRGERFNGNGERFNNTQRNDNGQRVDRYQNDRNGDRQQGDRSQSDRIQGERLPFADRQPREAGYNDRPPQPVRAEQPPLPRDVPPFVAPVIRPELPITATELPTAVVRAPRPPRRERPAAAPTLVAEHEQPEFLRRPVRRPRREAVVDPATPTALPDVEPSSDDG